MMKSIIKRFASICMVLVIVCSFSMSAFAADSAVVPSRDSAVSQEEGVEPLGLGNIIATNAGTIYGGSGMISVYLPSSNFFADFCAGIGYADRDSIVTCYVTDPNGEVHSLGSIVGSGSFTSPLTLTYAPAGTYTFTFVSAIPTAYEVVAYIYDWPFCSLLCSKLLNVACSIILLYIIYIIILSYVFVVFFILIIKVYRN